LEIENQSLSDLLFLLTTDSIKNDSVLKANIEKRVDEIREEDKAKRQIEEIELKSRSKYRWIFLALILSLLSYCSFQVFTSDNLVKRIVYNYKISVPVNPGVSSKEILRQFVQEDFHKDAVIKFPELGPSLKKRIRLNIKRSKDIASGKEIALIKIDFVVNEKEKGIYDHNAVLEFYLRKISMLMNINPEPYLKEINAKLAAQKI
jgi:hypothetical protein